MHINDVFAKNSKMQKKPIFFFKQGTQKKSELLITTFCAEICTIQAKNPQYLRENKKTKKVNILIIQITEPSSDGTVLLALFFTSNGHFVNGADVCDVNMKKSRYLHKRR